MSKLVNVVIVTYKPSEKKLNRLVSSISNQVNKVLVVNNGDQFFCELSTFPNVEIYNLKDNFGIAYATNYGLRRSNEHGAEFTLLSDQDTVFPDGYVASLLQSFSDRVVAVAPIFFDSVSNEKYPFFIPSKFFFKKKSVQKGCVEISQAIASGLLVKQMNISEIGLMNEDLFIDWVDFEWCWRARAKGYKIIGNADVVIEHQLGDMSKDLGFREINLRSPIRHYYITRNAFYLSLYSRDLDVGHRINLFFKSFRYIVGYPVFSKPHLKHLKAVLIGFWHGITKKLGKYDLK